MEVQELQKTLVDDVLKNTKEYIRIQQKGNLNPTVPQLHVYFSPELLRHGRYQWFAAGFCNDKMVAYSQIDVHTTQIKASEMVSFDLGCYRYFNEEISKLILP